MIVCSCRRISDRDYDCVEDLRKRLCERDYECGICLKQAKCMKCDCEECDPDKESEL